MIPHLSGQIELGISKIDPSKVRSDFTSLPFETMAFDASLADKKAGTLCGIIGEKLPIGKSPRNEKEEDAAIEDASFLRRGLLHANSGQIGSNSFPNFCHGLLSPFTYLPDRNDRKDLSENHIEEDEEREASRQDRPLHPGRKIDDLFIG